MWPINGASKAKRIKWDAEQNQISWAYMKMLRETDKTVKIYPVNPYVEVYRFRDNMYGLFNQNCDGMGDVWMYIIIGPEKAMVIDTAYGLGNLRGLVDEITGGMPLVVANTHTGPDHVLGNVHFETVYCHEYEIENVRNKCRPGAWDYLIDKNGNNIWLQFDKKDLPVYKDYNLIPVPDGHIFNLGGDYNVEMAWTGGHAPGHVMFLDKKGRNLFAGDDICSDIIGCGGGPRPNSVNSEYYSNLSTYRDCLERLVKRLDEFDYIFPGHFMVNLENHLLLNVLETLNAIIKDPDCYDYKVERVSAQGGRTLRMHKYIKGFGTIAYTENGVYPSGTKT